MRLQNYILTIIDIRVVETGIRVPVPAVNQDEGLR